MNLRSLLLVKICTLLPALFVVVVSTLTIFFFLFWSLL